MSETPEFVHPVDPFGGAKVETFASWQEAFGMSDTEWRKANADLKARLDEIDESRREAYRHMHEIWIV